MLASKKSLPYWEKIKKKKKKQGKNIKISDPEQDSFGYEF
jgi:hypothetical protein